MSPSCSFLTLLVAVVAVSGQNTCNYYKSGSEYFAPGRCSAAGSGGISSFMDEKPVCVNSTYMVLESYASGSGCTGANTSSVVAPTNFKCDGTTCEVQFEDRNGYSFSSSTGCPAVTPKKYVYGVPGYCNPANHIFYCGTNGAYVQDSCTTPLTETPVFLDNAACYDEFGWISQGLRITSCTGGPAPPFGVAGYKTANSYTNCNFYDNNGTVGPIDICEDFFFVSSKARCKDKDTLEVGSWFGLGCSGKPTATKVFKRGDPGVDFHCTGNQCLLTEERYTGTTCPSTGTPSYTRYIVPGKCTGSEDIYYCHGTGNNQVVKEAYRGSSYGPASSRCSPATLWDFSADNFTMPYCSGGDTFVSCSLTGATPKFGSVSAGSMFAASATVQVLSVVLAVSGMGLVF